MPAVSPLVRGGAPEGAGGHSGVVSGQGHVGAGVVAPVGPVQEWEHTASANSGFL